MKEKVFGLRIEKWRSVLKEVKKLGGRCIFCRPKCRPQSDHMERSDLAKRFLLSGRRGREPRERERGAGA
jgi:hypothetical protein